MGFSTKLTLISTFVRDFFKLNTTDYWVQQNRKSELEEEVHNAIDKNSTISAKKLPEK